MSQQQLTQARVISLDFMGNTGSDIYRLRLEPPPWDSWLPGQFVMLKPSGADTRLTWARPFCISHMDEKALNIYFQVVGRGTALLTRLEEGQSLDLWGPLGNGFHLEPEKPTLLLAGGMGLAPLIGYCLAHPKPENLTMEFGHRLPLDSYPFGIIPQAVSYNSHLECGPEDRERFTVLLDQRIQEHKGGLVLACGPTPFLKAVQALAIKHGARTQLSLETKMACGIGACLGCVVKARPEGEENVRFIQTCSCGPNFWADQVEL